jgi:MFS family permease
MTPQERRASGSLALIYALRMLGLFLVLPVFAIEARHYPGGDDPLLLGVAMGIYGLTQAALQLAYGMASDRWGRKPVIVLGLLVFALGSFWAAGADSVMGLLIGRSLQGAGAISAAVSALLTDLTRDTVRTKAMALVGISIGLMFSVSLVLSPILSAHWGLSGLFQLTGTLALLGVAVILWLVPPAPPLPAPETRAPFAEVLRHPGLMRLNLGVLVLHAVQLALWMAIPSLLMAGGLDASQHWMVYLPAVVASVLLMGGLFALERRGHLKAVFLSAIALLVLVQLGLLWAQQTHAGLWVLGLLLWGFFTGFNVLEATQPSLVTRLAPTGTRGAAMGLYNTLQSLGFFIGGWVGGALVKGWGAAALFATCAAALIVWGWVARGMAPVPASPKPRQ